MRPAPVGPSLPRAPTARREPPAVAGAWRPALHLAIPRAVRARRVGAAIAAYLFMCYTNEGSGQRGVNR